MLIKSSSCPKCGASIFIEDEEQKAGNVPRPRYSCICPRPNDSAEESVNPTRKTLLS